MSNYTYTGYTEIDQDFSDSWFDPDHDSWNEFEVEEGKTCNYCYGTGLDRYEDVDCLTCYGEGVIYASI